MGLTKEKTNELKRFIAKSKRVWLVMKKPTKNEYMTVAKITAIGILIIGVVGFIISMIMQIFV
ncbi:MAG: protein translocase SEC61 complex subunit gamma [Candidatus Pacearchaeota archaeon]